MKTQKVRGHKRRWKQIEEWVEMNKTLDLDAIKTYQRDYVKIRIYPWIGFSRSIRKVPEPTRETKLRFLKGLIDVYDEWKKQLDTLNEPYYLKIWLVEPRFSESQVVCAFGDALNYYDNTFFETEDTAKFNPKRYGRLSQSVSEFTWEQRLDEDHYFDDDINNPEQFINEKDFQDYERWFNQMLKKPHRTTKLPAHYEAVSEMYSFKKGIVWLGEKM